MRNIIDSWTQNFAASDHLKSGTSGNLKMMSSLPLRSSAGPLLQPPLGALYLRVFAPQEQLMWLVCEKHA